MKQRRTKPRSRKHSTGQALVEMALVLPLLCVLMFAVIDLGYACFKYVSLYSGVRQAVRMAAMNMPTTSLGDIKHQVVISTPGLQLTSAAVTVTHITDQPVGSLTFQEVRITATHTHEFLCPFLWPGAGTITMQSSVVTPVAMNPGGPTSVAYTTDATAATDPGA